MKKNVRQTKYDPLVEEVMLLESNPQYALIRYKDGRECTVNTRQLAPSGEECPVRDSPNTLPCAVEDSNNSGNNLVDENVPVLENSKANTSCQPENSMEPCQSDSPLSSYQPESVPQPRQLDSVSDLLNKQGRVRPYNLRNRTA